MSTFLQSLTQRLAENRRGSERPRSGRSDRCACGQPVFFHNSRCLSCEAPLGYLPDEGRVRTLAPGSSPGSFRTLGHAGSESREWVRCANFESPAGCNWMVPAWLVETHCVACRLNRTIPDLSIPGHDVLWRNLEFAKRRLIAQLLNLRLPVRSRLTEDTRAGLMFDFLRTPSTGLRVLTGHEAGLITLNIDEADEGYREWTRRELREPHRTLLGHFRHESGHYYWERLVVGTLRWMPFREVFGDERSDYATAIANHYRFGPPADWVSRHVSAYAAAHPWEDWAETWAYYLHVVDTLDTALGFGLDAFEVDFASEPIPSEALFDPGDPGAPEFLELLNSWVRLTAVVNELTRSMGQPDPYPFALSKPAVRKLHFIHCVVGAAA